MAPLNFRSGAAAGLLKQFASYAADAMLQVVRTTTIDLKPFWSSHNARTSMTRHVRSRARQPREVHMSRAASEERLALM